MSAADHAGEQEVGAVAASARVVGATLGEDRLCLLEGVRVDQWFVL